MFYRNKNRSLHRAMLFDCRRQDLHLSQQNKRPVVSALHAKNSAQVVQFDLSSIEKLRKDFLLLLKQISKPSTWQEARVLQEAYIFWREKFRDLVEKRIPNYLKHLHWKHPYQLLKSDLDYWKRTLGKDCWDLSINSFPLDGPDAYWSKDQRFMQFAKERSSWVLAQQRVARTAWTSLRDFVNWVEQKLPTLEDEASKAVTLTYPEIYQMRVEGIPIRFEGLEPDDRKAVSTFLLGVKEYRLKASQRFPFLLQKQLPIVVQPYAEAGLDWGGSYKGTYILFNLSDLYRIPEVLAHEMGHHIYKNLSKKAQFAWDTLIRGFSSRLDITKILTLMKEGEDTYDLARRIEDQDVVLYLQLRGLEHDLHWKHKAPLTKETLENILVSSPKGEIWVSSKPISAYANKNTEEAFCEAVARLVAYGPRTVFPEIAALLKELLPGIRVGSQQTTLSLNKQAKYKNKKKVKKQDGGEMVVYEYSDRQVANRNKAKAKQVEKLRHTIGDLREQVRKDLKSKDDHTKAVALAVGLADLTFERVGNEQSAKEGHFGVTGWQVKHLTFEKNKAIIRYVGKSGVKHEKIVDKPASLVALKEAVQGKKPGDAIVDCTAEAVNAYLKPFGITAKDIRGYHANAEMVKHLKNIRSKGGKLPEEQKERKKKLKQEFKEALEATADAVGHEAATLRSQYLVPGLEEEFMLKGTTSKNLVKKAGVDAYLVALERINKEATKTYGEKEDEEIGRLLKPEPKKKPPRKDLRNNRIDLDEDPDTEYEGADKDKDLSLNYKRVASVWLRELVAKHKKTNPKKERKPGDVWPTKGGFAAKNPDGIVHTFNKEDRAQAYAKGQLEAEKGQDGSKEKKEEAPKESPELQQLKKERNLALEKEIQDLEKKQEKAPGASEAIQEKIDGLKEDKGDLEEEDPFAPWLAEIDEHLDTYLEQARDLAEQGPVPESAAQDLRSKMKQEIETKKQLEEAYGVPEIDTDAMIEALEEALLGEEPGGALPPPRVTAPPPPQSPPPAPNATTPPPAPTGGPERPPVQRRRVPRPTTTESPAGSRPGTRKKRTREVLDNSLEGQFRKILRDWDFKGDAGEDMQNDGIEAFFKDLDEKGQEKALSSYQKHLASIQKRTLSSETIQEVVKSAKKVGKTGLSAEAFGEAVANKAFAHTVLTNPSRIVKISTKQLTNEQLEQVSKTAYSRYEMLTPEMRHTAFDEVKKQLSNYAEGTSERAQFLKVVDGLFLASLAAGDEAQVRESSGSRVVPEPSGSLKTLLKMQKESGEDVGDLLSVDFYGPKGRPALKTHIENLSDEDLTTLFANDDKEIQSLMHGALSKATKPWQKKMLRSFMQEFALDDMTITHAMMLSDSEESSSPEKGSPRTPRGKKSLPKTSKELEAVKTEMQHRARRATMSDWKEYFDCVSTGNPEGCEELGVNARLRTHEEFINILKEEYGDIDPRNPFLVQMQTAIKTGDVGELDIPYVKSEDLKDNSIHNSGDVWQTAKGWTGMNSKKVVHTFEDKEKAEDYAKGSGSSATEALKRTWGKLAMDKKRCSSIFSR